MTSSALKSTLMQYTEESYRMESEMAWELCFTRKVGFMKAVGPMTSDMVRAMNATTMATSMKVSSSMGKPTVKVFTFGLMVKSMMGSGAMVSKKAMASGRVSSEILILVNGKTPKRMATVYINGKTGIVMKVPGLTASNMAKALTYLPMGILTLASINKGSLMALASINGKTAVLTMANSKRALNMARANGRRYTVPKTATCMKANTSMTKRTVKACSHGKVATCTRVAIGTMREMAWARCTGLMGLSTRGSGAKGSSMGRAR